MKKKPKKEVLEVWARLPWKCAKYIKTDLKHKGKYHGGIILYRKKEDCPFKMILKRLRITIEELPQGKKEVR